MSKKQKGIRFLLAIFIYILYSLILSVCYSHFNLKLYFICDFLFLVFIMFMYKRNLMKDWRLVFKNFKSNCKKVIKYVFFLIMFTVLISFVGRFLYPNITMNLNNINLGLIYKESPVYFIFKVLVFGIIAEELMFREGVGDVISNKYVYIVLSSLLQTIFIFIFTGFTEKFLVFYVIRVFLQSLIFSYIYIKNKSNIVFLFFVKFLYNILPVIAFLNLI